MTDTLINDDGTAYVCSGDSCAYRGDAHCQNCGYAEGER